ncbi:FecR family protein [Pseudoalteromonas luteoviolacea]|uniref:FecR family protein n=1 Tax=Pseudoalteromonas luteoviolacea TaxID=43657 RepID=UPI0011502E32|nr:FecR family protein [Pseudoalteromonas luteoviolacea]TQF70959.1 FecR domain-containing protein [Pseudoalteromonas luteoviolacea]
MKISLLVYCCFMCFSISAEQVAKTMLAKHNVVATKDEKLRTLKRKSSIFNNDSIATGKLARAQFRFSEGTILTLGADTQFLVSEFNHGHSQKEPSASFEFVAGAFRVVTGEITKVARPNFKIKTPLGSIGIRGTDFWGGNLYDNESIEVILLDSEHPITIENQFGKVIITEPGTGSTLRIGKAPSKPEKWSNQKLQDAVKTIQ